MQIFIDSADISEIREALSVCLIDGVTTNPSLLSKISDNPLETAKKIAQIVGGPVSVEVSESEYDKMILQGKKILDVADNVILKLPITYDGLRACQYFAERDQKVNMTLCFSAMQALLAAKAGAEYVSPFVGRLDDIGSDGLELLLDIKTIFENYSYPTKILAASIRHHNHVLRSAMIGVDAITIPLNILKQLLNHPLTSRGLDKFLDDWKKSGLSI